MSMSAKQAHLVVPMEATLLRQMGSPLPPEMRLVIGTPTARLISLLMTWLDAPPTAVTVGRTVYIPNPAYFRRLGVAERTALLAHEAVHVRQWQQMGTIRFIFTYLGEYLRIRREGTNTHDPYKGISLEQEAIAVEKRLLAALETNQGGENLV